MVTKVINDRLTAEVLVEQVLLKNHENFAHIDYADIAKMRTISAFKNVLILEFDLQKDNWQSEIIKAIESIDIDYNKLKCCVVYSIIGYDTKSAVYAQAVQTVFNYFGKLTEQGYLIDCLHSGRQISNRALNTMQLQLIFATERSEQDALEDSKVELVLTSLNTRG